MEKVINQNVGVDISKDTFDAAFVKLNDSLGIKVVAHKKFPNTPKGFENLLKWSNSKKQNGIPISYTMEATGVYYENLAYSLHGQGQIVNVVLPNKAKKYAESLDIKSKTDKLDAKCLGQMGAERKLRKWEVNGLSYQKLKRFTRERDAIIQERTVVKNQLHAMKISAFKSISSIQRSKDRIAFLNLQIKEIEKELRLILAKDKDLSEKAKILQTIPGVALITIATIIAETNGFTTIENMNKMYLRLKEKKKISMIAAVAVQRKLLGLMYIMWKNNTIYDPNYWQRVIPKAA